MRHNVDNAFELLAKEIESNFSDRNLYEEFLKYAKYCDMRFNMQKADEVGLVKLECNDGEFSRFASHFTKPTDVIMLLTSSRDISDSITMDNRIDLETLEKLDEITETVWTLCILGSTITDSIIKNVDFFNHDNEFLHSCPYGVLSKHTAIQYISAMLIPVVLAMMIDKLGLQETLSTVDKIATRSFEDSIISNSDNYGSYYDPSLVSTWDNQVNNSDSSFENFLNFILLSAKDEDMRGLPIEWRLAITL